MIPRPVQISLLVAVSACFVLAPATTGAAPPTDARIEGAVHGALAGDSLVGAAGIDVDVERGVVTLTGSVENALVKNRAAEVAMTLRGVRSVVNLLEPRPAVRSDEDVLRDARLALLADPAARRYEVQASVANGEVTLTGATTSWAQKQLVEDLVEGVRGVRAVENEIQLRDPREISDSALESAVEERLAGDVWVDARGLEVNVEGASVTLRGVVGSAIEKARARQTAWIAGVANVDATAVDVVPEDDAKRTPRHRVVSDEEIERAVQAAFRQDPRVNPFEPEISCEDGVVTLWGTVTNRMAARAAERDAHNTIGVWRVRSHIVVRPAVTLDDEELAEAVRAALARDAHLHRWNIDVDVVGGIVSLSGRVLDERERQRAQDVAARVRGVLGVADRLEIVSVRALDDRHLRNDILEELYYNPFVDPSRVSVQVRDGVATLNGTVSSFAGRRAAVENAYRAGAFRVIDLLEVDPGGDDSGS